ncbi:MAG: peptide/nickel transport system permease protein [Bacteroidia bacterium]|jgi:peptide/nickel transport system permease protein
MSGKEEHKSFSFKAYAWAQFKKNKPAYFSLWVLGALAMIAIFAPIIANDQPLYAKYEGHTLFPAFSFKNNYELPLEDGSVKKIQLDIAKWKQMELESVIWAPVPYAPNKSDFLNSDYRSPSGEQFFKDKSGAIVEIPSRFRHRIGTNKKGEDVLSGLIHASRISLTIGILSMGIATLIGLVMGALAGYFGDNKLITTRGQFWVFLIGVVMAYYYGFMIRGDVLSDAIGTSGLDILLQLALSVLIFGVVLFVFNLLGKLLGKLPLLKSKTNIPVDSIISRMIEILISIPGMILIISIAAVAKPSIVNLMLIIGLTRWTGIARFTRAEFLKIRNLEYIQAGQSLGFSEARIIFKHALPNGVAPAFVAIAFGVAAAILIESSLSFLGVGVPPDVVTWGSLLSSGREAFQAWWLVIFPGFAIFITVTVYNLLGEGLRDALDPRLKS